MLRQSVNLVQLADDMLQVASQYFDEESRGFVLMLRHQTGKPIKFISKGEMQYNMLLRSRADLRRKSNSLLDASSTTLQTSWLHRDIPNRVFGGAIALVDDQILGCAGLPEQVCDALVIAVAECRDLISSGTANQYRAVSIGDIGHSAAGDAVALHRQVSGYVKARTI